MAEPIFNVLFLCTGNSARSILAESILKKEGKGRFRVFSAGSHPKGAVNPFAIKVLESYKYSTDDLRSKSWEEFAAPGAPVMDFVFTVCDPAAAETCPVWPGQPMTAIGVLKTPLSSRERISRRKRRSYWRRVTLEIGFPFSRTCRSEASTGWR
jgi:arsenate reductase (thioredoxin)